MLQSNPQPMTEDTASAGTVLIVDDNPTNIRVVADYLKSLGFKVPVATSGEMAIKRAVHIQPDLILLDVMMPGIDGFETCHCLKADAATSDIPIIFMTALADADSKIRGLQAGAVDYVTKPIHQEEVLVRIRTHIQIRTLTRSLQQQAAELAEANAEITTLNHQLKAENLQIKAEMELARRIQTSILPHLDQPVHPDFEIAAVMLTCDQVGGDYYDVLTDRDGTLWLAIGDVCGHGVTPGLIMMMAQTLHAAFITELSGSPKEIVERLNRMLYRNVRGRLGEDQFMTFTTLKYHGDGRFEHAGAHLDLLVFRQQTGQVERITTPGVWLNFIEHIAHATQNATFTINVGDVLVLYTDGLTEAHVPGGELFDIHRLMDVVKAYAVKSTQAMRDAIMQDVLAWCKHQRDDDMSLVVVRRLR